MRRTAPEYQPKACIEMRYVVETGPQGNFVHRRSAVQQIAGCCPQARVHQVLSRALPGDTAKHPQEVARTQARHAGQRSERPGLVIAIPKMPHDRQDAAFAAGRYRHGGNFGPADPQGGLCKIVCRFLTVLALQRQPAHAAEYCPRESARGNCGNLESSRRQSAAFRDSSRNVCAKVTTCRRLPNPWGGSGNTLRDCPGSPCQEPPWQRRSVRDIQSSPKPPRPALAERSAFRERALAAPERNAVPRSDIGLDPACWPQMLHRRRLMKPS
jgi:hypothetical protein